MININNYITEKLKINKNIGSNIGVDDDAICLRIDIDDAEMRIAKVHIDEITDSTLKFRKYKSDNLDELFDHVREIRLNTDYRKYTGKRSGWLYVLYNLDEGMDFIYDLVNFNAPIEDNEYKFDRFDIKQWTDYPIKANELHMSSGWYGDLKRIKRNLEK